MNAEELNPPGLLRETLLDACNKIHEHLGRAPVTSYGCFGADAIFRAFGFFADALKAPAPAKPEPEPEFKPGDGVFYGGDDRDITNPCRVLDKTPLVAGEIRIVDAHAWEWSVPAAECIALPPPAKPEPEPKFKPGDWVRWIGGDSSPRLVVTEEEWEAARHTCSALPSWQSNRVHLRRQDGWYSSGDNSETNYALLPPRPDEAKLREKGFALTEECRIHTKGEWYVAASGRDVLQVPRNHLMWTSNDRYGGYRWTVRPVAVPEKLLPLRVALTRLVENRGMGAVLHELGTMCSV